MALYVAADIGGTFTDFVVFDEATNELRTMKLPTTPSDPSEGIIKGLDRIAKEWGRSFEEMALVAHGSTVSTNALVEMRGARCGLITTRGFRDLLELRRQTRPHVYDLQADKPPLLIPRHLRKEVSERMLFDGSVETPLSEDDVRAAVTELMEADVESVAIVFLHSYANPAHELRCKALVQELAPHLEVYTSSEVLPQFREFERLSTTVVNAYVGPVIRTYLQSFQDQLQARQCLCPTPVMKSDGGTSLPGEAMRHAVSTIGSGPCAGVSAARIVGERIGEAANLITLDMGGTTTDISLVIDGEPLSANDREVNGWPIRGRAVSVHSIGAGGGSIAWVDDGGLLRVGPKSAGSTPGPACYGRGGTQPTLTDANAVLGRLDSLLGGDFQLDYEAAFDAIKTHIADPLGMSVEEAAEGILAVAANEMGQAIRLLTVEQGHDPRDFALVAFGGAGPLHAPTVAQALGIQRIIVPKESGVLSAFGVLVSDLTKDFSLTRPVPLQEPEASTVRGLLKHLTDQAERWVKDEGLTASEARLSASIDVRCKGQNYELNVPVDDSLLNNNNGPASDLELVEGIADGFHRAHEQAYGYAFHGADLEAVTFRILVRIPGAVSHRLTTRSTVNPQSDAPPATSRMRPVGWGAPVGFRDTPVYRVEDIRDVIHGPAIIEAAEWTAVVPPDFQAGPETEGSLRIEANNR